MRRIVRLLACLVGSSLVAGCTVAEPSFRSDLGGYAMIHEEPGETVVIRRADTEERQSPS